MLDLRSRRILLDGRFVPARVRIKIKEGTIHSVLPYHSQEAHPAELVTVIDFGDKCIGPGLVDVGVEFSNEWQKGGVTSIVLNGEASLPQPTPIPNVFQFRGNQLGSQVENSFVDVVDPYIVCYPDQWHQQKGNVVVLQADQTNSLASPFREKPQDARSTQPGTKWRTGRTRQGSEMDEDGEDDEEGFSLPQPMLNVIFQLERESYACSTRSAAEGAGSKAKARRPPPIQPMHALDYFSPGVFLRNYRVHLSLRPDDVELRGIQSLKSRQSVAAILRVSSKKGVEAAYALEPAIFVGTTIVHLLLDADQVRTSTWLKQDPPIRETVDKLALLQCALDFHDTRFVISSGHKQSCIEYDDFERAISNGPTMAHCLSALWTCAVADAEGTAGVDRFAVLWRKFSETPATIVGLETKGRIAAGLDADLAVFDLDCEAPIPESPSVLRGVALRGSVSNVYVKGKEVYRS